MATVAIKEPMNPNRSVTIDAKKLLWDGRLFETKDEASVAAESYKNDNFEVQMVQVGGTYLIYTRRVVKEVVVTAP